MYEHINFTILVFVKIFGSLKNELFCFSLIVTFTFKWNLCFLLIFSLRIFSHLQCNKFNKKNIHKNNDCFIINAFLLQRLFGHTGCFFGIQILICIYFVACLTLLIYESNAYKIRLCVKLRVWLKQQSLYCYDTYGHICDVTLSHPLSHWENEANKVIAHLTITILDCSSPPHSEGEREIEERKENMCATKRVTFVTKAFVM